MDLSVLEVGKPEPVEKGVALVMTWLDRLFEIIDPKALIPPSSTEMDEARRAAATRRAGEAENPEFYEPIPTAVREDGYDHRRTYKVLFVGTRDLCRSAAAAIVAGHRMRRMHLVDDVDFTGHWIVESAGIAAEVGQPVDSMINQVIDEFGITGAGEHYAKQLRADMLSNADIVLIFEEEQQTWISQHFPEFAAKVVPFSKLYELLLFEGPLTLKECLARSQASPALPRHWMTDPGGKGYWDARNVVNLLDTEMDQLITMMR